MATVPITTIPVMYRDAANWKANGDIFLKGAITQAQKDRIRVALDESLYFIPTQLSQPHLDRNRPSFPCGDDHVWHEMFINDVVTEYVDEASDLATVLANGTVEGFVTLIESQSKAGWDVAAASRELDIVVPF